MRLLSPRRRAYHVAAATLCVGALLGPWRSPVASALSAPVDEPVTGNATWYESLGVPYGGCGMTEDALETPHFIALNVFNTPRDYVTYPRPMPDGDPKIGLWNNGHNCGRWVEVTIGDYCTGINAGEPNADFCTNGTWVADKYNGAKLQMIVADSCGDGNSWCRDDPYHIDLHKSSLNAFVKDGKPVGDLADPENWNNRHVSWKFIPAPDYSGDIEIGFLQGSKSGWTAIAVSRLANGIHGLDYWYEDEWHDGEMDGDMGQAFIIKPHEQGGTTYSVRVRDITDEYLNDGRVYTFELPKSCDPQCADGYLKIKYTASQDAPGAGPGAAEKTCTATPEVTQSWGDGYQLKVVVTAGEAKIYGWTVGWALPAGQKQGDVWNGVREVDGSHVTVTNTEWNGALRAGATTSFGVIVDGSGSPPTMTCTAS